MEPVIARTRESSRATFWPGPFSRTATEWGAYGLCVTALLVGLFLHWRVDEAAAQGTLQERLQADAALLNTLVSDKIHAMDAALDAIRESRFWRSEMPLDDPQVQGRLASLASAMDGVRSIIIVDARGLGVASNRAELVGVDYSASARECFEALRERGDASFLCVSPPSVTPLATYTFAVSKRITGKSGGFEGVVICVVDPAWVAHVLQALQRRVTDLRLSVVHPSGSLVHSEPASGPWSGGDAPVPSPWWSRIATARLQDLFVGVDGDGRDRLVASYPVVFREQSVLSVVASRDLQRLRSAVRAEHVPLLIGIGVAAIFAALALVAFQRHRRTRELDEARVREAERDLRLAVEAAALGVWRWDFGAGQLEASPRFREIFGLPRDEPVTLERLRKLFHPEDRENIESVMARCLAERASVRVEHRVIRADGSVCWVAVTVGAFPDGEGGSPRLHGIVRDITGLKALQQLNEENEASLARMVEREVAVQTISAFAHDLNQPLLAISAYSEAALALVKRGGGDLAKLEQMLEGSFRQAQRAGALMHDMSAHLSQSLEASAQLEPFDLNALIRECVAEEWSVRPNADPPVLALAGDLPRAVGSPTRTRRVLSNLLSNAFESSRPAGAEGLAPSITVRTRQGDGSVIVSIADRGSGVPFEDADRIFSPFFSTKPTGLGLGLSISRALVESQGGELKLVPGTGPGAEFHFTLPTADSHANDLSH